MIITSDKEPRTATVYEAFWFHEIEHVSLYPQMGVSRCLQKTGDREMSSKY